MIIYKLKSAFFSKNKHVQITAGSQSMARLIWTGQNEQVSERERERSTMIENREGVAT